MHVIWTLKFGQVDDDEAVRSSFTLESMLFTVMLCQLNRVAVTSNALLIVVCQTRAVDMSAFSTSLPPTALVCPWLIPHPRIRSSEINKLIRHHFSSCRASTILFLRRHLGEVCEGLTTLELGILDDAGVGIAGEVAGPLDESAA